MSTDLDNIYRVVEPYHPKYDGEILLDPGDTVVSSKDLGNGWTLGRNLNQDTIGIFPSNHIVPEISRYSPHGSLQPRKGSRPNNYYPSHSSPYNTSPTDLHINNRQGRQSPGHTPTIHHLPEHHQANGHIPTQTVQSPQSDFDSEFDYPIETDDYGRVTGRRAKPHMLVKPNTFDDTRHNMSDTAPCHHHHVRAGGSRHTTPPPGSRQATPKASHLRTQSGQMIPDATNKVHPESPARQRSQMSQSPHLHAPDCVHHDNVINDSRKRSLPAMPADDEMPQHYSDYRTLECPDDIAIPRSKESTLLRHRGKVPMCRVISGSQIIYGTGGSGRDGRLCRLAFSTLTALMLALLSFLWLHYDIGFDVIIAIAIATAVALLAAMALLLSRLCRCVAALTLPSSCTTRGRVSLLLLLFAFLLAGPVTNLHYNLGQMSHALACSTEQSYNQSLMLLQPFDSMMTRLNGTVNVLQQAADNVTQALIPLQGNLIQSRSEIFGTTKTCKTLIDRAFNVCAHGIMDAQSQCLSIMTELGKVYHTAKHALDQLNPDRWVPKHLQTKRQTFDLNGDDATDIENRDVCEPLDTVLVCQSLNDSEVLCEPSGWARLAMRDVVADTKRAMDAMQHTIKFGLTTHSHQTADQQRLNATRQYYGVLRQVDQEFRRRTDHFALVVQQLRRVLLLAVCLLLYAAHDHLRRFLTKDRYDNAYVTALFKALDQKRGDVSGEKLLPLRKYERLLLVDTTSAELSPPEEGLYKMGLCVLLLHLLVSFVCYLFDYILYWILWLIRQHAYPAYQVTSGDSMSFVISGQGFIADLIHIFLQGFHPNKLFHDKVDLKICLPDPQAPNLILLITLFVLYFILILSVLLKAYMFRLRNRIVCYFYPERAKMRVLHLYNTLLLQRTRIREILSRQARANLRQWKAQKRLSIGFWLASHITCCRPFATGRAQCLVCGDSEDETFRDCETDKCQGVYCADCYEDLNRTCPLCHWTMHNDNVHDDPERDLMDSDYDADLGVYTRTSKIYC